MTLEDGDEANAKCKAACSPIAAAVHGRGRDSQDPWYYTIHHGSGRLAFAFRAVRFLGASLALSISRSGASHRLKRTQHLCRRGIAPVVLHRPSKTAIHTRSKLACSQSRPTLARLEGAGGLPATKATTEASPAEQSRKKNYVASNKCRSRPPVCRTKRACRHSVAVRTRDQGQHWQHPLICSAVTQRRAVLGTPGDRGRLVPFAYDPSKQALQIHGWSETARCSVHGRMSEPEWCTRRGLLQATTTWLSALERADPGPQRRAQRTKRTSGVRDKAPGIHRSPDRLWTPRTARHSWADMRQLKRRGTLSRGGLTISGAPVCTPQDRCTWDSEHD